MKPDRADGPEIFALPVRDAVLVYSPLQQVSALVNKSAFELLRQALADSVEMKALPEDLAGLADLLKNEPVIRCDNAQGPLKPMFLGFIPTRACNIACGYCDFGSGRSNHQTLDPKLAGAAVKWYADFLRESGESLMEIHFFGGEPFVAREVVETIVHMGRALAGRHGLVPHFEVSTNGVFERDYSVFVGDYFDAVVLSFDGFGEFHDRHRPINANRGSFDHVCQTASALGKSPTELCLRCCVSAENVGQLEEIGDWFSRTFQPSAINFETMAANPKALAAGLSPPDPYVFARHCHRARHVVSQYGINAVYAATESETARTTFCPVGNDTLIVVPGGRISSCYLPRSVWLEHGLDLDVGRIDPSGEVAVNQDAIFRLRRLVADKPRCANCFCNRTCAGGCHVNNTWPGSSPEYGDFCIQTRILTACKLLDDLGQESKAGELLADRDAMERLALNASDRIGK